MEARFEIPMGHNFGAIYADPPWPHNDNQNSRRRLHYDRMSLDEIKAIPVAEACHPDAHLWIWVTTTHMPHVFDVISAWGFEYKATCVWRKTKLGMGWWVRNRHEFLMIAARSKNLRHNPGSWTSEITGKSGKHSEKPESVYPMIEALSPGPFLELFSRSETPREGWTTLGSNGAPMESYGRTAALRGKVIDPNDGLVRGVGGLEISSGQTYHYLDKVIVRISVEAISQKGRSVMVALEDGTKKRVSVDKLRAIES